jgi:hypothetical protein
LDVPRKKRTTKKQIMDSPYPENKPTQFHLTITVMDAEIVKTSRDETIEPPGKKLKIENMINATQPSSTGQFTHL